MLETGTLSGGVRVVGEMMNRLVSRGWPVTVISLHPRRSMDSKEGAWFDLNPGVKWMDFYKTGMLGDYDDALAVMKKMEGLKIATYWRTAHFMTQQESCAPGEGFYIVQDFETTYAIGRNDRALVVNTYDGALRMLATSQYVMGKIPHATYVGIGLSDRYRAKAQPRNGEPLAALRRSWFKGYSELCEVLRYLAKEGKQVTTYGLDSRLYAFTPVKHTAKPTDQLVRDLLSRHSCYISTSRHEGFNLTKLEAMAMGCPVVGTPDHGSDEYCVHEENCLVGSTPREIADGVLRVLSDKGLAMKLAQGGLETVKRYKWGPVIDRMEEQFVDV